MLRLPLLALTGSLTVFVGIVAPAVAGRIRYGTQQRPGRASREAWQFRMIVGAAGIDIPKYTGGDWAKTAGDAVIDAVTRAERAKLILELAQLARVPEGDADTLRELTALFLPDNAGGPPRRR